MYLSPEFAGAFLALFAVYWLAGKNLRLANLVLLLFSWGFYASFGLRMLAYLLVYTVAVHAFGQAIARSRPAWRKPWLVIGISSLVVNLCAIKYYLPFVTSSSTWLSQLPAWAAQLLTLDVFAPIGISFISFQAISLLLECARDPVHYRQLSLGKTALYLAFFPTVIAGPICRPQLLLPQLKLARHLHDPAKGLALIAQGLFKKLVVAHWLASVWVDPLFDNPEAYNGAELLFGAMAYSIQIYMDFSGLTDLVRGLAWLLGFRLPENFRHPYLASNPRDFWRRWHISLSTWIRDYIYIPLGGNRHGALRSQLNLLLAMLISGLWHGAGLNYLVWGTLHGLGCIITRSDAWHLPRPLAIACTFLFTTFAWIFFRASDLDAALNYLRAMGNFEQTLSYNLLGACGLLAAFFASQGWAEKSPACLGEHLSRLHPLLRTLALLLFVWLCIELGPSGVPNFIYSQY